MAFLDKVIEIARKDVQTIVLPEAFDPRAIEATHKILEMGIAKVILVGDRNEILATAGEWKIDEAIFIDPKNFDQMDAFATELATIRKSKGMTVEEEIGRASCRERV